MDLMGKKSERTIVWMLQCFKEGDTYLNILNKLWAAPLSGHFQPAWSLNKFAVHQLVCFICHTQRDASTTDIIWIPPADSSMIRLWSTYRGYQLAPCYMSEYFQAQTISFPKCFQSLTSTMFCTLSSEKKGNLNLSVQFGTDVKAFVSVYLSAGLQQH